MEIVINPKYSALSSFIHSVPDIFEREGVTIYKARNEIKIYSVEDEEKGIHYSLNVKSYKIPIFINRIAYTFFRATKARRAYEYALKIISKNVTTPEPVAFIEEKKHGLLNRSFFICLHTPLDGNMRIASEEKNFEKIRAVTIAFGKFTAELNKKNILHIDYSPGNILYKKNNDGTFNFSIIDINRMKFCKVNMKTGCKNFCRMYAPDVFFTTAGKAYAEAMGYDEKACVNLIMKYRKREWIKRERRYRLKKLFKKN